MLDDRVARLERRCRAMQVALAILVGLVLVGLLSAADRDDHPAVSTKRLVIVDEAGREVGSWSSTKRGSCISFVDANGVERVSLVQSSGQGGLYFHNAKGKSSAYIVQRPDWWGLKLFGERSGAYLIADAHGATFEIGASGERGKPAGGTARLAVGRGAATLSLSNGERDFRIEDDDQGPFAFEYQDHNEVRPDELEVLHRATVRKVLSALGKDK